MLAVFRGYVSKFDSRLPHLQGQLNLIYEHIEPPLAFYPFADVLRKLEGVLQLLELNLVKCDLNNLRLFDSRGKKVVFE